MKECGDCALCCKLIEVAAFKKPAGQWCSHCTRTSCGIWPWRPELCQTYECLWKQSGIMGPELRPDRCKIVFELYEPEKTVLANVDGDRLDARNHGEPLKLIKRMVLDGYTVWVMAGKDRHCLLPPDETQGSAVLRAERARRRVMGWPPPATQRI